MNRFKFQPAQEHRRSLQQPKNDHVSLMATLDKCSQILRDDRLFLRNEIKNCNHQVLEIFKKYAKGSQLAELQVRLRKYVQNVKSRVKTEQLNKFKETLAVNSNAFPQQKRSNQQIMPSQSTLKQGFKPSCSTQLNRTTNIRSNKSQEHTSNHLNMNSSLRHFQQLLKQKFNQEIIEERQSQNVTSARLGRQEQMEQTKPKPLQQQFFDSIENKLAGRVASYNNFIPNKKIEDNLTFLNDFNKDRFKISQEEQSSKPAPWNFQKNAKKVLYQFQNVAEKEPEEINYGSKSRQKQSVTYEDKEDSIFDKHFFGSDKEASQVEQNQYFSQSSNNVNEIKQPISFTTNQHLTSSNIYEKNEPSKKWSEQPTLNFKLKESDIKPNEEPAGKTSFSRIQNSRPSEENLFTPLQLLNECRNFLKHRDNSTQKSNIQINQQAETSFAPSEVVLDLKHEQQVKPKQSVSSMKKDEENSYVFPEIKDSNKKQEGLNSTKKIDDTYHFTHFQTFANSMDQKPFAFPSKFVNIPAKHTFNGLSEQKIPEDFSIQDFLQTTMEVTDMNPFITVDSLSKTISSHQNSEPLRIIFKSYLSLSKHQEIFLTDLAETLNNRYNQEHSALYPHDDQVINSVYDLLDIEQKGYINKEDIDTFLNQIKEAEVENYDEVEEQLWRLFEGADFNNKHELTYWHFYLVKTSEEFQRVSQLLSEFQFEIERNQ